MVDEGGTVTVGDLQGYAEQHTEYEKYSHIFMLEQSECLEAECIRQTLARTFVDRTFRQGHCVQREHEAQNAGCVELSVAVLYRLSTYGHEVH